MKLRYEIRDTNYPHWKGQRFTAKDDALRELSHAVGPQGRFELYDRKDKKVLARSAGNE